jgi:isoquinoline 1-oxidoreductase beta subunit
MAITTSRREFLRFTVLAGTGLTLGAVFRGAPAATGTGARAGTFVQPFLRIDGTGAVTVICKHSELGQGVHTGLPTIVAEELDADWASVRAEAAPAGAPGYGNLAWSRDGAIQGTGGSTSILNSWEQLRRAGATARAMLVAAAARQWQVPVAEINVDAGMVLHAPSRRQAGFGSLAAAAAREPVPAEVQLKDPARFTLIGRATLPRTDIPAKVRGTTIYSIDQSVPGMKVALLARPPRFGASLGRVDAAAARRVPGVVDVVAVPRGVAVIADDTWAAVRGRAALVLEWDETGAEQRGTDALFAEFRRLAREPSDLVALRRGSITTALADATTRVEAEFEFPYLAHAPMEPLGAVCVLAADRCEIWAGSQLQAADLAVAAATAGLRPEQVVLHTLPSGGSFGRRANAVADFIGEVVSIARATAGRYPVKLTWTREDDLTGGMYRPMNLHRLEAGLAADGQLTALRQRIVGQSITIGTSFAPLTVVNGVDIVATSGTAAEQYAIPHVDVTWTNPAVGIPVLWWRSVEHTHTAFSKEVLIDELARRAGQDPVDYRLGLLAHDPRATAVLKLAAEKAGWSRPAPPGIGRGVAIQASFGTVVAQVAEVRLVAGKPVVERVTCAVDCGIAVNPDIIRQQMEGGILFGLTAALRSRITLTDGRVDQRNFDGYPNLGLGETPGIEVHIVPSGNAPTGVGEPAVPVIAPAVANALYALTGIPVRRLPLGT